jgi:hypothetical protein
LIGVKGVRQPPRNFGPGRLLRFRAPGGLAVMPTLLGEMLGRRPDHRFGASAALGRAFTFLGACPAVHLGGTTVTTE